jgi:hypothetical protein
VCRDAARLPPGDCESGGHDRETRHGRSSRPCSAYAGAGPGEAWPRGCSSSSRAGAAESGREAVARASTRAWRDPGCRPLTGTHHRTSLTAHLPSASAQGTRSTPRCAGSASACGRSSGCGPSSSRVFDSDGSVRAPAVRGSTGRCRRRKSWLCLCRAHRVTLALVELPPARARLGPPQERAFPMCPDAPGRFLRANSMQSGRSFQFDAVAGLAGPSCAALVRSGHDASSIGCSPARASDVPAGRVRSATGKPVIRVKPPNPGHGPKFSAKGEASGRPPCPPVARR